ncbi:MAG: AAA domain-containing protein [Deltaproteobacteria bacterium]|nr:AAA domain-containing protein [Deltaproteobacteria bacterium]
MKQNENESPPNSGAALALWFAEGVRSELSALEKDGKGQSYELLSGKLIQRIGNTKAVYLFIIADGTRIPEDATGKLKTGNEEYAATVISQQANRIEVCIEGVTLPPGIQRAMLIVDDTALLHRLAEVLEAQSAEPSKIGSLATTVFHPQHANVGYASLPNSTSFVGLSEQQRRVIEQACGSSVTFIWGPPGTGKTYTIAHLVTALIEAGERVLVSSHTHAAVDQSLYEAVKSENGKCGPLAAHPIVSAGKVLRIGDTSDPKIPDSVILDKVVDTKARNLSAMIAQLEEKAKPLLDKHASCRAQLAEWDKLSELSSRLESIRSTTKQLQGGISQNESAQTALQKELEERRVEHERAERAWFSRATKVERATRFLRDTESQMQGAETRRTQLDNDLNRAIQAAKETESGFHSQQRACNQLPSKSSIETKVSELALQLDPLEKKILSLQDEVTHLEQRTIAEARAIFCTLTKSYTGKELEGQTFNAVIVDEISMALPPLIFLVAGRASSRVILVGDFLQLPPIVRSDNKVSNARLGQDTFHLAGIEKGLKPAENCRVLTRLNNQRRMVPQIANVARHLLYNQAGGGLDDHPDVTSRTIPRWLLDFLADNPLVIVDTADFHCWSGKQPGSLSRFNFYSATVAVEIAALAAVNYPKPQENEPPPIGIVTPFAAQGRLLSKLIKDLALLEWVVAGTVHTFQGGQHELIIFDTVLDEPYWAARLCTPSDSDAVKRDLNVAVTRAKNKLVVVGSSAWLNKHAKPASGLGQLWEYLITHADLVSAAELVKTDRFRRVFDHFVCETGWSVPHIQSNYAIEHLDEESFFTRFATDLNAASESVFALAPYFGEYRWPRIEPLFAGALSRRVKVTIVIPPMAEVQNKSYVEKVTAHLRSIGAVVIAASGVHGKDVIIDEQIVYTGSMNWSSNRGRSEEVHRLVAPDYAKNCLNLMQAKYIREAAVHEDGTARTCPECGHAIQVVNQRRQNGIWDHQSMKVGCTNPKCEGYLRNIDERPPFREPPVCQVDQRTRYRVVRRGRGSIWQCPKHPRDCKTEKVVPGDCEWHPDGAPANGRAQKKASSQEVRDRSMDGRFIAYDNGTVLDTNTNLIWAARDNGSNINWANAKSYCENYRGGGHTDWRMPTQDELAGLYDESKSRPAACNTAYSIHVATELIDITCFDSWVSEMRGTDAAGFRFINGAWYWFHQSDTHAGFRALPVRSGK